MRQSRSHRCPYAEVLLGIRPMIDFHFNKLKEIDAVQLKYFSYDINAFQELL